MAPITLKSCPKVYIRETHRSKPPGDTLHFVEGMRDLLGMRDVREATDLDRIGIPVFTCWRLRPDESRTFHTGKGVSAVQAQVSLTLESIERYSSEFREEWADRLIVGSYNALRARRNTLDPTTLILSQFSDYSPEADLHWVSGYDICRNGRSSSPRGRSTIPSTATRGSSTARTPTALPRATRSRRPSSTR